MTIDGEIVSEVLKPTGNEFKFEKANQFFTSEDSNFGVTDVTYLMGTIYVAHGYSKGDFILTIVENNGIWSWGNLAWGGKGDNPGQFKTAHGVYAQRITFMLQTVQRDKWLSSPKRENILKFLMKSRRVVLFVIFLINRNIIF